MSLIRCFIAIELPDELKKELEELIVALKKRSPSIVKWVDPHGIHVTLKFLGEVSEELIDDIVLSMEEAASQTSPFQLEIGGLGAFPHLNRPQLTWVGVKGEMDKLRNLQRKVDSNTELLGFPRDRRGYSPHLTLGRVHNEAPDFDLQRLGKLLTLTTFVSMIPVKVTAVHLIRSQLTPGGPIYSVMKTAALT